MDNIHFIAVLYFHSPCCFCQAAAYEFQIVIRKKKRKKKKVFTKFLIRKKKKPCKENVASSESSVRSGAASWDTNAAATVVQKNNWIHQLQHLQATTQINLCMNTIKVLLHILYNIFLHIYIHNIYMNSLQRDCFCPIN